jgi:hypothetical protein
MTYQQHRNHVIDGEYPWPECQFCELWIIRPAIREMRNDYRGDGRCFLSLLDTED